MVCDFKYIYFMVENLLSSRNLLPRMKKHVELPYPLLENRVCLIWINFLANGTRQSKTLKRRNILHKLFSTNNKQNRCILLVFVVVAAYIL